MINVKIAALGGRFEDFALENATIESLANVAELDIAGYEFLVNGVKTVDSKRQLSDGDKVVLVKAHKSGN